MGAPTDINIICDGVPRLEGVCSMHLTFANTCRVGKACGCTTSGSEMPVVLIKGLVPRYTFY